MPIIILTTEIDAQIETCFDLSRSIDLHTSSLSQTNESAVDGVITGLIGPGEFVTWRARHFGFWLSLKSQITAFDRPNYFRDSMMQGPFARFNHDHFFEFKNGQTRMLDRFDYESPLGPIGRLADEIFLKSYLKNLLLKRNAEIKSVAQTNPSKFL